MPLKINLYHEVLRARHAEQYDPLRLSMMGLIAIVVCLAGYYVFALAGKNSVANALKSKQAEYEQLQPKVKIALEEQERLNKELGLAESVQSRIDDRFFWAPIFENLVTQSPVNIQIIRCSGDITPEPPRRCQISIDGMAAGPQPRSIAEEFRVRILEKLSATYKGATATFRTLEDGPEKQLADGTKADTASFTITIAFLTKATPEPTPPPRKSSRKLNNPEL